MRKFLFSLVVMMFSLSAMAVSIDDIPKPAKLMEVTDVVTIETTSIMNGQTLPSIKGFVVGLETPPMGDYKVKITNGNGFKGERFTVMSCNLKPYLEELDYVDSNVVILSTAFTVNGQVYNSLGFYSGSTAYPSDNYQVVVKNGKDRPLWNSMNCTIK